MATPAIGRVVAVAGVDDDLSKSIEFVRDQLHEGSVVPLTHGLGPDPHDDTVVGHLDLGGFRRASGGGFEVLADGDAAQTTPLARLGAALFVAVPVGHPGGHGHIVLERAAVIGGSDGIGVGELILADQVAPAQFHRVDPQIVRRHIDQALHDINRFRAAGAAIGPTGAVLVTTHFTSTSATGTS